MALSKFIPRGKLFKLTLKVLPVLLFTAITLILTKNITLARDPEPIPPQAELIFDVVVIPNGVDYNQVNIDLMSPPPDFYMLVGRQFHANSSNHYATKFYGDIGAKYRVIPGVFDTSGKALKLRNYDDINFIPLPNDGTTYHTTLEIQPPTSSPASVPLGGRCASNVRMCAPPGICGGIDSNGEYYICVAPASVPLGGRCIEDGACAPPGICSGRDSGGYSICVKPMVTPEVTPKDNPTDTNSCVSYDNKQSTFSCKPAGTCNTTATDSTKEVDKGDSGVYSCSEAGKTCCENVKKYSQYYHQSGTGEQSSSGSPTSGAPGSSTPGYCADGQRNSSDQSKAIPVNNPKCTLNEATSSSNSTNPYCLEQSQLKYQNGSAAYFYTCPTTPGGNSGISPNPAPSGICASKGGVDTNFSKPDGYWGPTCDGKLIGDTDPKTAKPGRKYADRYKCNNSGTDGKNYEDVLVPSADTACDSVPWLSSTPAGPVCKTTSGVVTDCSDKNTSTTKWSCTYDYTSTGINDGATRCSPDGKRWCSTAGTWVSDSQGCGGLQAEIGQTCGEDKQCADYNAGARCLPFGAAGQKTCQWPGGVAPSPTAGASTNCAMGFRGTGCQCDASINPSGGAGGCLTSHNCEPAADDPSKSFCVPFRAGVSWCIKSQTAIPATACMTATAYTTPTAVPTPSQRCPNDGNHLCVPNNSCQAGFGPTNDPIANGDCISWNHDTPLCYVKGGTPLSTCTAVPVSTVTPTTPKPTPPGCPVDNGDGRVNSCQSSCSGSYPNAKADGNADCAAAYGTIRGACCTSN